MRYKNPSNYGEGIAVHWCVCIRWFYSQLCGSGHVGDGLLIANITVFHPLCLGFNSWAWQFVKCKP